MILLFPFWILRKRNCNKHRQKKKFQIILETLESRHTSMTLYSTSNTISAYEFRKVFGIEFKIQDLNVFISSQILTICDMICPFMLSLPFSVYCTYVCLSQHSFPCDGLQTRDQILKSSCAGNTSEKKFGIAYLAVSEDQPLSKTAQIKKLKAKMSRILKC